MREYFENVSKINYEGQILKIHIHLNIIIQTKLLGIKQ
ncbi:hypothetical protein BCM17_005218 [Clostridium beijerinckii]|nr:hypothetical protein [Clostridium beijerinckii]